MVYERNIPADIKHYRLAFYWLEPDLTKASDIDVYLDAMESDGTTVCSSGFAYQDDFSINNAIHIEASDIPSCAAFIRIRYQVYAMPSGQTRTVYNSDLYDNEDGY